MLLVQVQLFGTGRYGLEIYTSVAEELKLKVRKFWGLILTFVAVTEEKRLGGEGGGAGGGGGVNIDCKKKNNIALE